MKNKLYHLFFLTLSFLFIASCGTRPKGTFDEQAMDGEPDYSNEDHWAALPTKADNADRTPPGFENKQGSTKADVFFLYPTNYFGDKAYNRWNAEIDNEEINLSTDKNSILFQASAFNGAGKIYAPRYRQVHLHAYYAKDEESAKKAFDLAYEDIKNAFAYYMKNYNNGRPIIIASHSQGTTHAARLLEELFDGKPLENKLVAAYLLGIPVDLDRYSSLKACETGDDTSCLIGWRTWKNGATPPLLKKEIGKNVLITNPLSWKTNTDLVPKEKNPGTVLYDFEATPQAGLISAQIYKSILWANKPKFPGSILLTTKNFHRGDVNLYYVSLRENASNRVSVFLQNK